MRKGRTYLLKFTGGPFDERKARMESRGTLEFKFGSFKGFYDANNSWVSTV